MAQRDPDQATIEAVQRGDPGAFRRLLRRNERWVRGVVYGVLGDRDRIDDVTQQVWATFWERLPDLRDTGRWRPWLYRLARNAALDAGRDATRRKGIGESLARRLPPPAAATPDGRIARSEQQQAVLEAINNLPELYREPFVLRHLENWSYQQIGELLDLPVDTVETRLVRARRMLREALKDRI